MKPLEMKRELEKRLLSQNRRISYDRDEQKLRIEDKTINKGVTLSISKLIAKWKVKKEQAIEETVHYVEAALQAMTTPIVVKGNEKNIFPVIRSTSFPTQSGDGKEFLWEEHTAETRVFYAIDQGSTFALLTNEILEKENVDKVRIKEMALFNLRSLQNEPTIDEVAGNTFYFLNKNDGYDASKVLNDQLLKKYSEIARGQLTVSVPHQDVLIIADIRNETGYDILAQMVFQFFTNGRTPITALPFIYKEGELEPVFILAHRKPKQ
ncbi:DUF1444 domain-containing protein [Anaerobacillus alkalidiazotrophicus]|uniref:DUF1444 domain-containing protein n=1 Tax=Anaerobacillus alkalidiazotrophicus TaxID=472963 RepID=A0A1S2M3L5_9BACI|nr:DUF1444 family protein [Anaerobacillus alkalidiazotrophicus]OIJ18215.1 DUF1444 domain-containing protein [Anaerobacillus alkalidiazotrophicus]OIJ19694.1 DUF1444 domain-containing protein [Anaerobacillus alkalidiazotrophicus]